MAVGRTLKGNYPAYVAHGKAEMAIDKSDIFAWKADVFICKAGTFYRKADGQYYREGVFVGKTDGQGDRGDGEIGRLKET